MEDIDHFILTVLYRPVMANLVSLLLLAFNCVLVETRLIDIGLKEKEWDWAFTIKQNETKQDKIQ